MAKTISKLVEIVQGLQIKRRKSAIWNSVCSRLIWFRQTQLLVPEHFFILCAVFFGLPILLLRPSYDVPDFSAHLIRGYSLAEGTVIPRHLEQNTLYQAELYEKGVPYVGGLVPKAAAQYMDVAIPNYEGDFEKIAPRDQLRLYTQKEDDRLVAVPNNTAAVYNPLSYVTLGAGFFVGKILHLTVYGAVLLVSALHFAIWLLLIRKAIQVAVIGKWFIVVLSLMPMTLFLTPSISTDPLLFGVLFLFFAYLTRYIKASSGLSVRDMVPIILLSFALAVFKQTYFIFILLTLVLHNRFLTKKDRNLSYLLGIGLPLGMVGIWTLIIKHMNIIVSAASGNQTQLHNLLIHPQHAIQVYLNTILFKLDSVTWTFFGVLGRLSLPIPLICVLLLGVALGVSIGLNTERLAFTKRQKYIFAGVLAASILMILTSFYVYWSPYDSSFITGLQGRYFIPIVIFALPLLTKIKFTRASQPTVIYLVESAIVFSLIVSTILMSRFYFPDLNVLHAFSFLRVMQ